MDSSIKEGGDLFLCKAGDNLLDVERESIGFVLCGGFGVYADNGLGVLICAGRRPSGLQRVNLYAVDVSYLLGGVFLFLASKNGVDIDVGE